ncbi:MAG: hypothetical protein CVV34_04495 [Methanomicrobiales archaeon HGW-Methanomicrobiales-5]|nr:MAG: hypothetical protein CVV34_04495 [Methanomicrobiales archaeon HGW-Methanomicrobiales-5]
MIASTDSNFGNRVASLPLPIRITREQYAALSLFHRAVAAHYLERGTGEVILVDSEQNEPL